MEAVLDLEDCADRAEPTGMALAHRIAEDPEHLKHLHDAVGQMVRRTYRPLVYVAGPFRAETPYGVELNVRAAEHLALEVWKAGAVAICPHTLGRFYSGELPDDRWLEGDLDMLDRCDAIMLTGRWPFSVGASVEKLYAERVLGMRVFQANAAGAMRDFRQWVNSWIARRNGEPRLDTGASRQYGQPLSERSTQ